MVLQWHECRQQILKRIGGHGQDKRANESARGLGVGRRARAGGLPFGVRGGRGSGQRPL